MSFPSRGRQHRTTPSMRGLPSSESRAVGCSGWQTRTDRSSQACPDSGMVGRLRPDSGMVGSTPLRSWRRRRQLRRRLATADSPARTPTTRVARLMVEFQIPSGRRATRRIRTQRAAAGRRTATSSTPPCKTTSSHVTYSLVPSLSTFMARGAPICERDASNQQRERQERAVNVEIISLPKRSCLFHIAILHRPEWGITSKEARQRHGRALPASGMVGLSRPDSGMSVRSVSRHAGTADLRRP